MKFRTIFYPPVLCFVSALFVIPASAQCDPAQETDCSIDAPEPVQVNREAVHDEGDQGPVEDAGELQAQSVVGPGFVEPAPLLHPAGREAGGSKRPRAWRPPPPRKARRHPRPRPDPAAPSRPCLG